MAILIDFGQTNGGILPAKEVLFKTTAADVPRFTITADG